MWASVEPTYFLLSLNEIIAIYTHAIFIFTRTLPGSLHSSAEPLEEHTRVAASRDSRACSAQDRRRERLCPENRVAKEPKVVALLVFVGTQRSHGL